MSSEHIDGEGQIAWIAEHADVPYDTVAAVLDLELDYMVAVGIADAPGYELRYYSPEDVREGPKEVDPDRLAQDAERFLGISIETADKVFEAESRFLEMRGLLRDFEPPPST